MGEASPCLALFLLTRLPVITKSAKPLVQLSCICAIMQVSPQGQACSASLTRKRPRPPRAFSFFLVPPSCNSVALRYNSVAPRRRMLRSPERTPPAFGASPFLAPDATKLRYTAGDARHLSCSTLAPQVGALFFVVLAACSTDAGAGKFKRPKMGRLSLWGQACRIAFSTKAAASGQPAIRPASKISRITPPHAAAANAA